MSINGDGGAAAGSPTFTVNAGPTVTLINPATRRTVSGASNVVITGTGFVTGAGGTTCIDERNCGQRSDGHDDL